MSIQNQFEQFYENMKLTPSQRGDAKKKYNGGLVSCVINKHSGKKYIISTAQEIGKDYWSSVVAPSRFFGLWMDFKKRFTWIRNSKKRHKKFIVN